MAQAKQAKQVKQDKETKRAKLVVWMVVALFVVVVVTAFALECYKHTAAKTEMLAALDQAVGDIMASDPTFAERMATYAGAHSKEEIVAAIRADCDRTWGQDWYLSLDHYYYREYFSNPHDPTYPAPHLVNLMEREAVSYLALQEYYAGLEPDDKNPARPTAGSPASQ